MLQVVIQTSLGNRHATGRESDNRDGSRSSQTAHGPRGQAQALGNGGDG